MTFSPIFEACRCGDVEKVKLIIDADAAHLSETDKDGWQPLHHAVWNGHESVVRIIIMRGSSSSVSAPDKRGRTPLHHAARKGHVHIVSDLISAGAAINALDDNKQSPLHALFDKDEQPGLSFIAKAKDDQRTRLVQNGNKALDTATTKHLVFSALAAANANLNDADRFGDTPLHLSVRGWYEDIALELLNAKVNINAKNKIYETPVHEAARNGLLSVLACMLTAENVDVGVVNKDGQSALHIAIINARDAAAKALIDAKSDVNVVDKNGRSVIFWAVKKKNHAIATALITAGAKVNTHDKKKNTPLLLAVALEMEETALALLEAKADVRVVDSEGNTPLTWASTNKMASVVKVLLEREEVVYSSDPCGFMPLHLALKGNGSAAIALLLIAYLTKNSNSQSSVEVSRPSPSGFTSLAYAAGGGMLEVVNKLIEVGVDVSSTSTKRSDSEPLYIAVTRNYPEIVMALINAGAKVDIKVGPLKVTPLLAAAEQPSKDLLSSTAVLLSVGANVSDKDLVANTALHNAVCSNNETAVNVLLDNGVDVDAVDSDGRTALEHALFSVPSGPINTRIILTLRSHMSFLL